MDKTDFPETNPRKRGHRKPQRNAHPTIAPTKPCKVDYHNDFTWYNKHAEFLSSVGQVSSNHARGTSLGRLIGQGLNPSVSTILRNEPTVTSMLLMPTACGRGNPVMSTAQIAFYQFIRAANSGSRNYETADLFMYIFAVKEFLSFLGYIKRLLLTTKYFEVNDRSVPGALLTAEIGNALVDGNDLLKYLSEKKYDLLAKLNSWITQFNTLAIPANIPLLQKAYWTFNHVYKTDDRLKPTYACYAPSLFMVYDETGSEHGGRLVAYDESISIRDYGAPEDIYDGIIHLGDVMLSSIMTSEDVAIISGDIRKAFSDSGLMAVANLNIDTDELQIHDASEIKDQMHNARLFGRHFDTTELTNYGIEQRNGYVHDNTVVSYHNSRFSYFVPFRVPVIDIAKDTVDVPTFVEATRLTGVLLPEENFKIYSDFWVPEDVLIYYVSDRVGTNGTEVLTECISVMNMTDSTRNLMRVVTGNTEYIPLLLLANEKVTFGDDTIKGESDNEYMDTVELLNPIHNLFRTTENALRNILEATILSELNIPFIKG